MTHLIGHNGGPDMGAGRSWRAHCWRAARARLLPVLPIEVVRLRVKRAAEIGLDYKTYAGVRATTGHDIVAFLFSTNALRLLREGQRLEPARAEKIAATRNLARMIAAQPPHLPDRLLADLVRQGLSFDAGLPAPGLAQGWGETRRLIVDFLATRRLAADQVLVIGDTALERGWVETGRMAGYLAADRYFGTTAG